MSPAGDADRARVGLCAGCRFAAVSRSRRGSEFWRCRVADTDAGFARYPALPVHSCSGFEPAAAEPRGGSD